MCSAFKPVALRLWSCMLSRQTEGRPHPRHPTPLAMVVLVWWYWYLVCIARRGLPNLIDSGPQFRRRRSVRQYILRGSIFDGNSRSSCEEIFPSGPNFRKLRILRWALAKVPVRIERMRAPSRPWRWTPSRIAASGWRWGRFERSGWPCQWPPVSSMSLCGGCM